MKRYVDVDKAGRVVAEAAEGKGAAKLRRWFEKQPTAPTLVSRKRAAEVIGVNSSYISRLENQGRMPEPIPVEGGAPAYELEPCEKLGAAIRKERARRAQKRKEVSPA